MKDVFFIYDTSCFYEIVILNYFLSFSNCDMVFCSLAGVDVLDNAGILRDVKSTHSTNEDLVNDKNIITARANAYVDFAIEVAKKLDLFVSEEDLQQTVNFWKYYNRAQ